MPGIIPLGTEQPAQAKLFNALKQLDGALKVKDVDVRHERYSGVELAQKLVRQQAIIDQLRLDDPTVSLVSPGKVTDLNQVIVITLPEALRPRIKQIAEALKEATGIHTSYNTTEINFHGTFQELEKSRSDFTKKIAALNERGIG